jgi:hypothetical protein
MRASRQNLCKTVSCQAAKRGEGLYRVQNGLFGLQRNPQSLDSYVFSVETTMKDVSKATQPYRIPDAAQVDTVQE